MPTACGVAPDRRSTRGSSGSRRRCCSASASGSCARHLRPHAARAEAGATLGALPAQYVIALAGTLLVAVAIGWLVAGRVLRPLRRITRTARRVSEERLDERIALDRARTTSCASSATRSTRCSTASAGAFDAQRRFVANASHELRTPLTVIRTEADVTLANPDADRRRAARDGRGRVGGRPTRTEALLDGLLLLARSRAGLRRARAASTSPRSPRARGARRAREARRAASTCALRAAPRRRRGDAALLERLAANLVENARPPQRAGRRGRARRTGADRTARAVVRRRQQRRRSSRRSAPAALTEPFERARPRGAAPRRGPRPLDRPGGRRGPRRRARARAAAGRRARRGGPPAGRRDSPRAAVATSPRAPSGAAPRAGGRAPALSSPARPLERDAAVRRAARGPRAVPVGQAPVPVGRRRGRPARAGRPPGCVSRPATPCAPTATSPAPLASVAPRANRARAVRTAMSPL